MDDLFWSTFLLIAIAVLGTLATRGGGRGELRVRRRWDSAFDQESRRVSRTDATGMLVCRSCGASASERAGRCPSCGAVL